MPALKTHDGVSANFDEIESLESVHSSTEKSQTGQTISIDLNDVLCGAATNSALADLIEAERHALNCRAGDVGLKALDLLLQGEALEQRNKAAGAAGGLFLGLVEVRLQQSLLADSEVHLEGLAETIKVASENGFATNELENELAESREQRESTQSKLSSTQQILASNLQNLLMTDSQPTVELSPVYELKPDRVTFDAPAEERTAELNRPSIQAMELALSTGMAPNAILKSLVQFDSRLGLQPEPKSLKSRILRRQLAELLKANEPSSDAISTRREQFARIIEAKKKQARLDARTATIKIQGAVEKLTIANSKVERLISRAETLDAKQALDSQDALRETNQNWIKLQAAKSERISAAVEYEMAILELLMAQGLLASECGFALNTNLGVHNCPGVAINQCR